MMMLCRNENTLTTVRVWKVWIKSTHVNFKNSYLTQSKSKDRGAQGDKWYHCWGQHWPQYFMWQPKALQSNQRLPFVLASLGCFPDRLSNSCPLLSASLLSSALSRSPSDLLTRDECDIPSQNGSQRKSVPAMEYFLSKRTKSCKNESVTFTELCAIKHNTWLTVTRQGSGA